MDECDELEVFAEGVALLHMGPVSWSGPILRTVGSSRRPGKSRALSAPGDAGLGSAAVSAPISAPGGFESAAAAAAVSASAPTGLPSNAPGLPSSAPGPSSPKGSEKSAIPLYHSAAILIGMLALSGSLSMGCKDIGHGLRHVGHGLRHVGVNTVKTVKEAAPAPIEVGGAVGAALFVCGCLAWVANKIFG